MRSTVRNRANEPRLLRGRRYSRHSQPPPEQLEKEGKSVEGLAQFRKSSTIVRFSNVFHVPAATEGDHTLRRSNDPALKLLSCSMSLPGPILLHVKYRTWSGCQRPLGGGAPMKPNWHDHRSLRSGRAFRRVVRTARTLSCDIEALTSGRRSVPHKRVASVVTGAALPRPQPPDHIHLSMMFMGQSATALPFNHPSRRPDAERVSDDAVRQLYTDQLWLVEISIQGLGWNAVADAETEGALEPSS